MVDMRWVYLNGNMARFIFDIRDKLITKHCCMNCAWCQSDNFGKFEFLCRHGEDSVIKDPVGSICGNWELSSCWTPVVKKKN
jgi:hypothetical protein